MKKNLNTAKWISLIIGILLIIIGCVFYRYPASSLISLSYFISAIFIATGILRVIRYFVGDIFRTGSFLIVGILDILIGVLMAYVQPLSAITIAFFLGFWEVFSGISEIVTSIDLRKFNISGWWLGVIIGIMGIILGIMLINNPLLSSIFLAVYAIMYGATFIVSFFSISSYIKKI